MLDFPGGTVIKNPPANAGNAKDVGLIPGLGRSPEKEVATQSSVFVLCFVFLAAKHVGSYLPNQGSNLHPLHCKAKS